MYDFSVLPIARTARVAASLSLMLLMGCRKYEAPSESRAAKIAHNSLPPGVKGYGEVFYATDRQPIGTENYGSEASDAEELKFGLALISIPELHHIGDLERPWQIVNVSFPENARRHVIIVSRTGLSRTISMILSTSRSTRHPSVVHSYSCTIQRIL